MCDQDHFEDDGRKFEALGMVTRRQFGVLVGAGIALMLPKVVNAVAVTDGDVTIKTPDGSCDAALFTPRKAGRFPAVLMWPDIMGLRPAFRDMGRRLAGEGYVVLVPNPFYRSKRAPVLEGPIDFGNPAHREVLNGYRKLLTPDAVDRDAGAFVSFLDAQAKTDNRRKAGVQGYCMSGAMSFRTAAVAPQRIAAVASLHGGNGLVTQEPDSPHLLIPRTNARFLVLQAQNDDERDPAR
jgi:carboxymethylenebutenolidase